MTYRGLMNAAAVRIVLMVGTMECAIGFAVFVLVPLAVPKLQPVVQFISSALLQLVLLPLLMVGSNLLGQKAEIRAQQDHEAIMAELQMLRELKRLILRLLGEEHLNDAADAQG